MEIVLIFPVEAGKTKSSCFTFFSQESSSDTKKRQKKKFAFLTVVSLKSEFSKLSVDFEFHAGSNVVPFDVVEFFNLRHRSALFFGNAN